MESGLNWERLGYEQELNKSFTPNENIDWKQVAEHWQRIAEEAIEKLKERNLKTMDELNFFLKETIKNSHKCAHCVYCHGYKDDPFCFIAYNCIQHDFKDYNEGDEEE